MCGIAGCYQQVDGQKLVDIMTDRIAHRGPDAAGVWGHQDEGGYSIVLAALPLNGRLVLRKPKLPEAEGANATRK